MVLLKEWKEPFDGEKVGFPGKVSLPQGTEGASGGEKLGFPTKVGLP
jgi:hypothetical protein